MVAATARNWRFIACNPFTHLRTETGYIIKLIDKAKSKTTTSKQAPHYTKTAKKILIQVVGDHETQLVIFAFDLSIFNHSLSMCRLIWPHPFCRHRFPLNRTFEVNKHSFCAPGGVLLLKSCSHITREWGYRR